MRDFCSGDNSVEGDKANKTGNYIVNNNCVKGIDLIPAENLKDHEDHRGRQYAKQQIDQRLGFLKCCKMSVVIFSSETNVPLNFGAFTPSSKVVFPIKTKASSQ